MNKGVPYKSFRYPGFRLPVICFLAGLLVAAVLSIYAISAVAVSAAFLVEAGAPVIDLNGLETPGLDYAVTFVEDEGPVTLVAENLAIISDRIQLTSATITLENDPDKPLESLDIAADLSGTNIKEEYSSQKGILRLTGSDSVENYEAILRTVTYLNASQAPDTADREVTFIISDGSEQSGPATSLAAILAVNDAPLLDNGGDMQLSPIEEDDQAQIGNYVAMIIASAEPPDRIIDPDDPQGMKPEGIAVIEVGDSNGTWEFSLDSGSSWSQFAEVNNSSAVLLDESARIRFLPDANYTGIAGFIFRAWDQTTVEISGERADASLNGGSSAFSTATESAAISVLAVNDPPVVDLNGPLPGKEYAASFLSDNAPVPAAAPEAFVDDVEGSEIVSLKITLTNRPNGAQESLLVSETRAGIKVTPYDPATGVLLMEGAASLEEYSTLLRKISYLNEAAQVRSDARIIEFVASEGTDRSQITRAILVAVLSNVAPVLDPAAKMQFTNILEDNSNPAGDTIGTLLHTTESDPIQDADPDALHGFAVVGAENSDGIWQFSIDAGNSWLPVGQVSDNAALLLNEQAKIRFLPNPNFGGASRSITVRAWDQSEGANGIGGVDVSTNGGVSPFSSAEVSIPVIVQPINDAPVITITTGTTAQYIEGNGAVVITGPTLQIEDIDNDYLQSAAVSIKNLPPNEPDVLEIIANGSGINADYDGNTGTLLLTGKAHLADYQAVLRSATFNNLSQDPAVEDRSISFVTNDGSDSSGEAYSTVSVQAVNDVPLLDLNGEGAPGTDNAVYFDKDGSAEGGSMHLAEALQIQDPDNTVLIGATVHLQNRPDGMSETLSASTEGSNITATYGEDRREIKFSGQDSLAAYQKVLRTVFYTNRLPYANRAVREVSFAILDASLGISRSYSNIIVRPQYAHIPFIAQFTRAEEIVEEPNDSCPEAVPITVNVDYEFGADDKNDWFTFAISEISDVTVEITEFAPEEGQLIVADGACGDLELVGHNGDFSSSKIIDLDSLKPDRYYVWLINDGRTDLDVPYTLRVNVD